MNRPRSRRTLLASIATTAAVGTGGFEYDSSGVSGTDLADGLVPADQYECSDVDRPEPDPTTDEDALEPRAYPSPPWKTSAGEDGKSPESVSSLVYGASRYVTAFERAYRRNAFLDRYQSATRTFDLQRTGYRTIPIESETNREAVLVALRYDLTMETQPNAVTPRDEWNIRVTYYLDERLLLRARYNGVTEGLAVDPDPRTQGDLVACFD
ncbi:hypothetical protein [Natrinema versiforme]|uniref:Uncharacterized protein n=1 Tax=Natrinema versiforme JCM 10478 TaxID=1227496 RepID=L9XX22_9EURY|nr:hypothetical protein [Natrinema versiforme]ELY65158.1 hypothetical protein C489_15297 [Natrinema versiforme JCM 10478]